MMISEMELDSSSTSSPPLASTRTPTPQYQFSQQQNQSLALERRMQGDSCFHCGRQGHWIRDCPFKTPTKKSQPSTRPSPTNGCDPPPLIPCRCGHGNCRVLVSHSFNNPDRRYYTCPGVNGSKCGFFKWCDKVRSGDSNPPKYRWPLCPCGICQRLTVETGPDAGRSYYVCQIKKGHGACPFFQWEDTLEITTTNGPVDERKHDTFVKSTSRSHQLISDLDDDLSIEHSKRMKFESLVMENPQNSPTFMALPGPSEKDKELRIGRGEYEETSGMLILTNNIDPSHVEASRDLQNLVMLEAESRDPNMKTALLVSRLTSQAEIHRRQTEFWRQITAARDTSNKDYISQMVGLYIVGWWGRLAFPPSRCLSVLPPKPFFCCIFPSFDPIFVPQDKDVSENEGLICLPHSPSNAEFDKSLRQMPGQDAMAMNDVPWELSNPKSPPSVLQGSVPPSMLEMFEQAALNFQNKLITHLESMKPLDHESMSQAAEVTFAALAGLPVNCTPFCNRVNEFIACMSSLSDIEQSGNNDHSSKELIERYQHEKARYDGISCTHDEVLTAFTASKEQLQSLRQEASRVRNLLLEIEKKLSCCEDETKKLETRVGEISRDMLDSEKSLEAASQEAEEAMKVHAQRELKRNAAKAALEKARARLRQ